MTDKEVTLGYLTPTNATISNHDYQFLSTSQQSQCRPFNSLDNLEKMLKERLKAKYNFDQHRENTKNILLKP